MSKIQKFPHGKPGDRPADAWRDAVGAAIELTFQNPGCGYSILAIWFGSRMTAYWVVCDTNVNIIIPPGHKWSLALWVPPRECWATPGMHPFSRARREPDA